MKLFPIPLLKAFGGGRFGGAGGGDAPRSGRTLKNRPGLVLKASKTGAKRWQKSAPDQPSQRKPGGGGGGPAGARPKHVGADVQFRHPETGETHEGRVIAHGDHGVTIMDSTGESHKVPHGHYLHPDAAGDAGGMKSPAAQAEPGQAKPPAGKGGGKAYPKGVDASRLTPGKSEKYKNERHWVDKLDHQPEDTQKEMIGGHFDDVFNAEKARLMSEEGLGDEEAKLLATVAAYGDKRTYNTDYEDPDGHRGETQHSDKPQPVKMTGGTRSRRDLHIDIMREFLDHVPSQPKGKQEAIVMMGGAASGKSSSISKIYGNLRDTHVNVNPDDIKAFLPEYHEAVNAGEHPETGKPISSEKAAGLAHEESSLVSKVIQHEAMEQNKNVLLDGTGANLGKMKQVIGMLKKKGYNVKLMMVDIDKDEAHNRMLERADKTGRLVPEHDFNVAHDAVPGNFHELAKLVDHATLMNNDKGAATVWQKAPGEADGKVVHPELYKAFQQREAKSHAKRQLKKGRRQAEGIFASEGGWVPDGGGRGGSGSLREAASRAPETAFRRGAPTGLAGVYRVERLTKAVPASVIRSADDAVPAPGELLTPPELMGNQLTGANGEVIKGAFKIGSFVCEYTKGARQPAVLTMSGPCLPVPFHMIVRGWADAQAKAERAARAFVKGDAAPDEGVFRNLGDNVAVAWPGRHG